MTDEGTPRGRGDEPDLRFYRLNTDGSGNGRIQDPDQGAIGAMLKDPDGNLVPDGEVSEWIGPATNTVAEYWALIEGLRLVRSLDIKRIDARVDSRLLVEQLDGTSRVTKEYLLPFHRRACALLEEFGEGNVKISWVDRTRNSRADELATKGLRERPQPIIGADA